MRLLLTGGSGFLGGRVTEVLAGAGHQVVLLARHPDRIEATPRGVEIVAGDLTDPASLERALAGSEALVHCAALVKRWVPDRREFDRVNVEATSRLFDLAGKAGVRKILYCSSFMALGPTDGTIGDERSVHDGGWRNDYERTKVLADRQARERQAAGAPLVILYPGVVYGPGRMTDGNILAGVARDLIKGKLPGMVGPGDRRQCLAFVEDVAFGFRLALERAVPGSRYMLGGENLTVREMLELMAAAAEVAPPRRVIPYGLAAALGKVLRWQASLTGIEPMLTDEEVEIYRREWAYSSAQAESDLGYTVLPAREGIRRMVSWLIETGTVAPRR